MADKAFDPVNHRGRLSRPRHRKDQGRAVIVRHDRRLFGSKSEGRQGVHP